MSTNTHWDAGSAAISDDGMYRYSLTRAWSAGPAAVFIGLNPSTADGTEDDPTIRRCVGFAKRWGCGTLVMLNLYAYRATNPGDLVDVLEAGIDIEGLFNWVYWNKHLRLVRPTSVVAAWGSTASTLRLPPSKALSACDSYMQCLGLTKGGYPRHPLYIKGDTPLQHYPPAYAGSRHVVNPVY